VGSEGAVGRYDKKGIVRRILQGLCNREEYCKIEHNKEFLTDVCMTTIEDFLPKGRKHSDLIIIPLVKAVAQMQDKTEFLEKLDEYLKQIEFDEKTFIHVEIGPELHKHMK